MCSDLGAHNPERALSYQYRRIVTHSTDELANAVPGGRFWVSSRTREPFAGSHKYLSLDGLVLNHVGLGNSVFVVGGEREANSTVCSVIGPRAALNGSDVGARELALGHPGFPLTLATAGAATLHSFTLERQLFAEFPELDLPFGFLGNRRPGRWKVAASASASQFTLLLDSIFDRLKTQPALLDGRAARTALRHSALAAICRLADDGAFESDVSAAGRHTQIMLRFERALEEVEPEHLDILTLCRLARTSRRSLEAIVRGRTGYSPWDYVRWRRLSRARERLANPGATTRVTGIATELGIWHFGRFAGEYAAAFGESPVETLRRSLGAATLPGNKSAAA